MSRPATASRGLAVPASRLSRLARFGGLASGIAGEAALRGAQQWARGERPQLRQLILTPSNITRLTDQLARMRGAAMKVGQLMSMDTGDLLPPELADILSRLRAEAHPMPPQQLKTVLNDAWGRDWLKRFHRFDVRPIAAASIGQVHRAQTRDGRDLAIKVQYPGVRRSIDSDVDNVAGLIRLSGLIPKGLNIMPLLAEAKKQLHEEADYRREGAQLARFGALLADAPDLELPQMQPDLTTDSVLAMTFVEGVAVEAMADASQAERDRIVTLLMGLLFRELFEFRLMQTDPNFANFRYNPATRRLVLLDFGATREIPEVLAEQYRALLRAGLAGEREAMRAAALDIGFFATDTQRKHQEQVLTMMALGFEPLRHRGAYDFATSDMPARMRDAGIEMGMEQEFLHVPPTDTLFLQRKFAGVYLLATRLRARVDIGALLAPWVGGRAVA